ncbi:hypothetical protein K438DRAFT_1805393 [Mycena galopus ATCC 62051]|nr:hypothetical protein K438DRAFT_1805393 [Mycena galopus ATCC 62051]
MVLVLLDGSLLFARPGITLDVLFVRTTTRLRHEGRSIAPSLKWRSIEEPRLGLLLSLEASLHNTMLLSQQLYYDKQYEVLKSLANLYVLIRYTRRRGLKMVYGMRDLDKQTAVVSGLRRQEELLYDVFARNHNRFIDGLHRVWESYRLAGVPDDQRPFADIPVVVSHLGFEILKTFRNLLLTTDVKSKCTRLFKIIYGYHSHHDDLDTLLHLAGDYVHIVMHNENRQPPQHTRCWTPDSISFHLSS